MRRLLTDAVRTLVPAAGDRHGPLSPMLLVLTVVTGLVDAVSYLALGHVFVANMTGNVVFLGFALAGDASLSVLASVVSLLSFLAGAFVGGRLGSRFATHRGHLLRAATGGQTALLCMAVAASWWPGGRGTTAVQYMLIVVLALAMGLQNAVARRLGVPDLTTTVLTLTLTGLAADSATARGEASRPGRRLLSVLAMFTGAVGGAVLIMHDHLVVVLALALLCIAFTSVAAHRLSAGAADWTKPRP